MEYYDYERYIYFEKLQQTDNFQYSVNLPVYFVRITTSLVFLVMVL